MAQRVPEEAFEFYVGLGHLRSYQAVADQFGVSKRSVTRKAVEEDWAARVTELEASVRKKTNQVLEETLEEMNLRHLKVARFLQNKALEALRSMPITKAMEAVRTLEVSLRAERSARGEPEDDTASGVETVIRREYERWMTSEADQTTQEVSDAGNEEADDEQAGPVR